MSSSYASALQWLVTTGSSTANNDNISRRISILSKTTNDISIDLNFLLSARKANGGWGLEPEAESNILDTSLALQALKAANYPDLSVVNTALAYLTSNQNPDGGWGFRSANGALSADPSNIYMTAIVSATLQQFPQTAVIANAITKATVYILSRQNTDGGFASSTSSPQAGSSIYETSLAYSALVSINTDTNVLGRAINFMAASQAANGSWNDDPYSTALALKALYLSEHVPSAPPAAATTGSIMGTIVDATTNAPLSNVSVQLTSDASHAAATDANGMFALYGIPSGSQQITLSHTGYATVTITASISAGTFINVGKVGMTVNPTTGTVMGIVWNADRNKPFGGVTVQTTSGAQMLTTLSAADGSYKITGVNPGSVTVGTPSGPVGEGVYWNVPMTGTLAPGGIMIYNPMMSGTHPPFINVNAQTEKAIYRRGDTVNATFHIQNNRSIGYTATLNVLVTDPTGSSVFTTSVNLSLIAKQATEQTISFSLPDNSQGGFYTVRGDVNAGEELYGSAAANFGIFKSSITVTPALPSAFIVGANTVSFTLANTGSYAVSDGALIVNLTDPDGQVITAQTQPFTLAKNETKTLTYGTTLPELKFGTYTLTYTQSDETTPGQATLISLPNTISVTSVYDKTTYRIRETANVLVKLNNTGKFNLDAVNTSITAPDAAYTNTKLVSLASGTTSVVTNAVPLPASLTAGQHTLNVSLSLASGSTTTASSQYTIPDSAVTIALDQITYTAGGTINPTLLNTGGVDTSVQYSFSLFDARAAQISSQTGTRTVQAGTNIGIPATIPNGAVDGRYSLVVSYNSAQTGKADIVTLPLTITGVKANVTMQTDKQAYLTTENITGQSSITNNGTPIQNGNLHLQVVTTEDIKKTKTWTTQADFQQGVRNGVDTYGINDWLIPNDDFDGATLDTTKWSSWGNASVQSGKLFINDATVESGAISNWQLDGDFDVQVNFDANVSYASQGAAFGVSSSNNSYAFSVKNTTQNGYEVDAFLNGSWSGWHITGAYANSGTFRIARTGTTIIGYYLSGTQWIEIYRLTYAQHAEKAKISFSVWRGLGQPSSAKYDNFRVNSGKLETINETVDSIRLLPMNDNFDDSNINTNRWIIQNLYGTSGSITESSGALNIKITNGKLDELMEALSTYSLNGDFDVSVDWGDFSANGNSSTGLEIGVFVDVNHYSYIKKCLAGGYYYYRDVLLDGNSTAFNRTTTSQNPGKFRVVRSGSSIRTYYHDGSAWVELGTATTFSSQPARITLKIWMGGNETASGKFDNFIVSGVKYLSAGKIVFRHDGNQSVSWKELTYKATEPIGTSIKFRTRTAPTEAGLATALWSDYITQSGAPITNGYGRWIEIEATLATNDTSTTPLLNDVTISYGHNPGDILWQTDVPVNLASGLVSNLTNTIGMLNVPGKLYFEGTLTSSTNQVITEARYPFYIVQGNTVLLLNTDKKIYKPGDTVTFTGEVRNLAAIDAANLSLLLLSQGTGSQAQTLYTETFTLPAGASHSFTATTTAGSAGIYPYTSIVTQNTSTLAEVGDQYEVSGINVSVALTAPDRAGKESFTLTATLKNSGKVDAGVQYGLASSPGNTIATETLVLPAGETRTFQYWQQIATDTTYTVTVTGDLNQTLAKTVAYDTTAVNSSITANLVTDKIAYDANALVSMISTVQSFGTTSVYENLTAVLSLKDPAQSSQIYMETKTLASLMPGAAITFTTYWNSGTNPSGSYPATLEIRDSSGVLLATAGRTIVIAGAEAPHTALKAQISVDKQSLLTGEPVTATYIVTNTGNADIQNVVLTLLAMNTVEQTAYAGITSQATLTKGASITNTWQIDTTGYSAKDYLVILRANIAEVEETLAGTYFRIEGAPSVPSLAGPAMGSDVLVTSPTLSVNNASDPNDDKLTYQFEVYADSSLANIVTSGTITEQTGITSWAVPMALTENQTYYWRSRAYDGKLYGPWMDVASFRVNVENDPPTAPAITSPIDGAIVSTLTPSLTVTNATDPDSISLTYNYDLALDPDFITIITTTTGVFQGAGTTSWQMPLSLTENTWYYWRAQADDWLLTGPWSQTARFFVNTTNEAPSVPVIISPATGATVPALSTSITVSNSTDPDSPVITYSFELDTVNSFDTASIMRSPAVPQGYGITEWSVDGLADNTIYFARAKASDGSADSDWSAATMFFVNTANDAPTAPTLANPSNGSGVTVFTPALSVHNATDADKDALTYVYEVYSDTGLTTLVTATAGVQEQGTGVTSWTVPIALTENQTYYWRVRAYDGQAYGPWMTTASFFVNTANDAPGAPSVSSPLDNSTIATLTPTLAVINATDPDSDTLTYEFELYTTNTLVTTISNVPQNSSGTTQVTVSMNLTDNTVYQWRARAYDGDRYGPWTALTTFTVHISQTTVKVRVELEPEILAKECHGGWLKAEIELPHEYHAKDVNISSIRLEGVVPAEIWPHERHEHHYEHGCEHDHHGHHHEILVVKFKRCDAAALLPEGRHVPVHITGTIGTESFEGVDIIKVISGGDGGCH